MSDITNTLPLPVKQVGVSVDATNTIHVKPDPVIVDTHNVLVVFTLATDGWHFPASGAIVVTTPGSDFPYSAWTVKPQQAAILDLGANLGDYEYTVTVVNDATGQVVTLDPVIKNGNPTCACP
jgi:hypothetical protein